MKLKVLALIVSLFFLIVAVQPTAAQQCSNDSLFLLPSGDVNYTQSGFIDPNLLPCVQSGTYSELIIPYRTYNQGTRLLTLADSSKVPVSHIYSIKVESISNLPAGLCWTTIPSNQIINDNQVGVIIIKGTTSVAGGLYPLSIGLSLNTQGNNGFTYTGMLPKSYQPLLGQSILKVQGSDNICPAITY